MNDSFALAINVIKTAGKYRKNMMDNKNGPCTDCIITSATYDKPSPLYYDWEWEYHIQEF